MEETQFKDEWPIYSQQKLVPSHKLKELSDHIRRKNKTIATVNGSFDLLHSGHLHILFEGACLCDVLIVALNTDDSVARYKGDKRPIITLQHRLQMMTAIGFVDYVTWFSDDDPRKILADIRPNVHVNGSEWGENCIEASVVKAGGGKLHIVQLVEGLSTSKIIKKIKDSPCAK